MIHTVKGLITETYSHWQSLYFPPSSLLQPWQAGSVNIGVQLLCGHTFWLILRIKKLTTLLGLIVQSAVSKLKGYVHLLWIAVCCWAQSCLTLCDPKDSSLLGSPVHGIFQARKLEQVSLSFSRGSSRPRDWTRVSCVPCIGRQTLCRLWSRVLVYCLVPCYTGTV